jgi:hypothetical protein
MPPGTAAAAEAPAGGEEAKAYRVRTRTIEITRVYVNNVKIYDAHVVHYGN